MPCLKDKTLIENLWVCKRFSAIKLLKEFRNNWKIVKKIQLTYLINSFLLFSNKILCQLTSKCAVLCGFNFIRQGTQGKMANIALNDTPSHSYGTSLAIWDHTMLPATRHK